MSWQDELRLLDAKLAAGELSLREHRKQREELLAAESGGFAPSPVVSPILTAAPTEPAPPRWPAEPPPERPAPRSRRSAAALLATDRPTSAPSPLDERATDSIRYPTIHEAPTVITRAVAPGTLPGLTPPPARQSVPALPTRPVRPAPRKPTWPFVAFGVLVVLVMIIAATWLLGARDNGPAPTPGAANGQPMNPADAADRAEAKLPTLPGAANPQNSTMSIDKALELKLVTPAQAGLLRAAGAQEVIMRAASDPPNSPNGTMLLVIPTASASQAANLADGLRKNLTQTGFTDTPLGPAGADQMYTGSNPQGRVGALWYSSDSLAVGLGVSQPLTGDPGLLRTRLEQLRTQVTGAFPAL